MKGGVDINQIFRMAQQAQEKMEKEMETARRPLPVVGWYGWR